MDDAVIVFATFHALPGKAEDLRRLLSWMVGNSRSEPGCERYDLYRRQGTDETFHLFERYRDPQALDAHRASEHYVEYRRRVVDLIEGPIGVGVLHPIDVAG
ncbi:MAG TPA: putative quinol monooxygenase [Actinomycetota bacterium]|nr:putative quinol monooxygenase [Actinomycetota bacterium]